jgi:hypothetical protein
MAPTHRWSAVIPVLSALLLAACGEGPSDEHVIDEPAMVEPVGGGDVARVTLTERAAERLDIQTAPAERDGTVMVVPSAAVLVDPDGDVWVYTNPAPLVFVRHEINIDHEDRGQAFLSDGPPPGTQVVTVGAAELYGAEFGVGH